jgi:hypothetical protein
MRQYWLMVFFFLIYCFLGLIKTHSSLQLHPLIKTYPPLKLGQFSHIKNLNQQDKDLLELWESFLTGRVRPVSNLMQEQYATLGLKHLFTPSGFHLSAVFRPLQLLIKSPRVLLGLLTILWLGLTFLSGQFALKRMVMVKWFQAHFSTKVGFLLAIGIDFLFGGFQNGSLSFCYSVLFLSIVYSGLKGPALFIWFFFGQILIAYFQEQQLSILILILSPLLSLALGLVLPLLFLLALPLWEWQMNIGLLILKIYQTLICFAAQLAGSLPLIEVHFGIIVLITLLLFRKKSGYLVLLVLCNSLGSIDGPIRPLGTNEFRPKGSALKINHKGQRDYIVYEDGHCRRELRQGVWLEKCSPRRRSIKKL